MLGGQPNQGWQLCFPHELHAGGWDFRLYDGTVLENYLLMRWKEPGALAVECWSNKVIKNMKNEKSPGLDGLHLIF